MDKISLIFAVSREMILKRFENKPEEKFGNQYLFPKVLDLNFSSSPSTVSLLPVLPSLTLRGTLPSLTLRGALPSLTLRGALPSLTLRGKSLRSVRSQALEPPPRETIGEGVPDLHEISASSTKYECYYQLVAQDNLYENSRLDFKNP